MNYTSVEQSKKLLELGLNPDSADMFYEYMDNMYPEDGIGYQDYPHCEPYFEYTRETNEWLKPKSDIPCWSLGALLEVIPITCDVIKDFHNRYYCSNKFADNPIDKWHITTSCKNSIEAAFEMVVWLLENDYIKTK